VAIHVEIRGYDEELERSGRGLANGTADNGIEIRGYYQEIERSCCVCCLSLIERRTGKRYQRTVAKTVVPVELERSCRVLGNYSVRYIMLEVTFGESRRHKPSVTLRRWSSPALNGT
jgi:hypothetical protein